MTIRNRLLFYPRPQADQFTYRVRVTAAQTTHPKFTFAAGYPPAFIDWGDGTARTAATSATEYTHTYVSAGEYTVTLILVNQAKWLTNVDIGADKVISVVTPIQIFLKLKSFDMYTNAAWIQNISNWLLTPVMTNIGISNTTASGNISGLVFPSTLVYFFINSTSLSGDNSNRILPAGMKIFQINSTSLTGCPVLSSMVSIEQIFAQNCALPEATVDLYLSRCWAQEAFTTYATPTLNLGGTDAPPSPAGAAIALLLIGAGWIVTTS